MKRRLLTSALAAALGGSGLSYPNYRSWNFTDGPTVPVAPTLNRERQCTSCRVGILTGTKCFACSNRRLK
ncbi:MAG: hypothetical protein WCA85_25855 [Paraburkholderia sp.]|uniref:hypothetical protein n=1 Tax=Paraburkholderia sp. TaxID=1926495 RepID=UPI003C526FC1